MHSTSRLWPVIRFICMGMFRLRGLIASALVPRMPIYAWYSGQFLSCLIQPCCHLKLNLPLTCGQLLVLVLYFSPSAVIPRAILLPASFITFLLTSNLVDFSLLLVSVIKYVTIDECSPIRCHSTLVMHLYRDTRWCGRPWSSSFATTDKFWS